MNPAAAMIVDHMMGDDEMKFEPKRVALALAAMSLVAAVPIGGAALINSYQIGQTEALSGTMETVIEGRSLLQAAHASGVASGLTIGGVHVPVDLVDRIETIVEAEIIAGARVLTEARMTGLEEALSGGWSADRLEEYVSRIETADPDLGRIITEETDRLLETGAPEERARSVLRAMAVKLMTGEPREEPLQARQPIDGPAADQARILDQAQTRIWSRLEEPYRGSGPGPYP